MEPKTTTSRILKLLLAAFNIFLLIIFSLLALSMFLMGNLLQSFILFCIVLLIVPQVALFIGKRTKYKLTPPVRGISMTVLLMAFLFLSASSTPESIYRSPEAEATLMALYDAKLAEYPVPYESVYVDTSYGRVHVLVSGPADAPPVLLLHASGLAGWSWMYNVEELSKSYRTYSIDTIGDAGKSVLYDLDNFPRDGRELSDLCVELTGKLGVERAYVVGASQGGYIATNYAIHEPERVEKLVLLGPMGYSGTENSVLRIMLVTFFPVRPLQDDTVRWALGDDPAVLSRSGEWFRMVLDSIVVPAQARPRPFTAEELNKVKAPTLLVLGSRDNLVGNPEDAEDVAENIPDVEVRVLDSGHAIGVEKPEEVNEMMLGFFGEG